MQLFTLNVTIRREEAESHSTFYLSVVNCVWHNNQWCQAANNYSDWVPVSNLEKKYSNSMVTELEVVKIIPQDNDRRIVGDIDKFSAI